MGHILGFVLGDGADQLGCVDYLFLRKRVE